MADVDVSKVVQDAFDNLERASDGASMRKAIIEALTTINENGGNAITFNGHYADYFLFKDDFLEEITQTSSFLNEFDENPIKESAAVIESGNINNYLNAFITRLRNINGGPLSKNAPMIAAQMKILSTIKDNIRTAIENKGGTIEELDSFEDYAKRIQALKIYDLEEKEVTTNGETAQPSGKGFSIVHVNVQPVVKPKMITTDGDYDVDDEPGVDAWNPVYVQVPGAKDYNSGTSYNPGSTGSHSSSDSADFNLDHLEITKNGTYNTPEGKSAIGSANINVNGLDDDMLRLMRFDVTFENYDGEVLWVTPEKVAGGSSVAYGGTKKPTKPSIDGRIWTFSHWLPSPDYVDHDMTCVAQFTEAYYGIDDSQTSWEEICSGGKVSRGMIKVLNLSPFVGPEYYASGSPKRDTVKFGPIRMQCVSMNEGGSTWVSLDTISYNSIVSATQSRVSTYKTQLQPISTYLVGDKVNNGTTLSGEYAVGNKLGWLNSPLRVWLETEFYNQCIPDVVRNAIVPVNKPCYTIMSTDLANKDVSDAYKKVLSFAPSSPIKSRTAGWSDGTSVLTKSTIWIPSNHEIWGCYTKSWQSLAAMQNGSVNRTLPVEYDGDWWNSYYGNYVEPDAEEWTNDRQTAVQKIYSNAPNYVSIKHNYYYPYSDIAASGTPINSVGVSRPYFNIKAWPTRTSIYGNFCEINYFGNPKRRMNSADNVELKSPDVNIAYISDSAYNNNGIGISFGFVIK